MNFCAIIVAAGSSRRMNSEKPKLLMKIGEKTVIRKTLETFENAKIINSIVLVIRKDDEEYIKKETLGISKIKAITYGGKDRQDSVLNGVAETGDCDFIVIHDGARPFIKEKDIENVCNSAVKYNASSLAVPVKDTIKECNEEQFVVNTPERSCLWQVQTPQVFNKEIYLTVAKKAVENSLSFTDDCQLFESFGEKVYLCNGDYENIKITTPEDILIANVFENKEKIMRIGQGYDVHRLVEGRDLILGGVNIPYEKGLLGHSDADVLLHAISDALLGAAALGDIGKMFPDTDPLYKGADSLILLEKVGKAIADKGYFIENIDATIIAQSPKLSPYISKMNENIARVLNLAINQVNIKATTEEKLGFTGSGQGISSSAVCLIHN